MIIKLLLVLFFFLNFTSITYSAGNSSNDNNNSKVMSDFDWGERKILKAKKYEKKGKIKKAEKNYKAAIKFFLKANEDDSVNPDIYNYLGFANRKTGNFTDAEMYYLIGLELDPKHNGINEYLGELYVQTNRIDKAKERLAVLKNCNCDEFQELELIIKTRGTKVY